MLEATDDGDGGHFGQQFEQHDVRVVVGGTWWDRGEESVHRGGKKSERRGAHHFVMEVVFAKEVYINLQN